MPVLWRIPFWASAGWAFKPKVKTPDAYAYQWAELVDRAEQTAKDFATEKNIPHEINLQKYKGIGQNRLVWLYYFFAVK